MIVAASGGLNTCMPAKPTVSERMAAIDGQLAEWRPMVDMMQIRQGSDGRYQLLIKPATTSSEASPAPSLQDPGLRLDAQAATLCDLSQIVGRVALRQGSDGRKQLLAASQPDPRDEQRYCPDTQGQEQLTLEERLTQHELLVADMDKVIGGVVLCESSDGRMVALGARPDGKQRHCKQRTAPQ